MLTVTRILCALVLYCAIMGAQSSSVEEGLRKEIMEILKKCPELELDVDDLITLSVNANVGATLPKKYACFIRCIFTTDSIEGIHMGDDGKFIIPKSIPEDARKSLLDCLDGLSEDDDPCMKPYKFYTMCYNRI